MLDYFRFFRYYGYIDRTGTRIGPDSGKSRMLHSSVS